MLVEKVETKEQEVCSCGRAYTHCRYCGRRALYPKKYASEERTRAVGSLVIVYRCKNCGAESDSTMPCQAPIEIKTTDFRMKPVEQKKEKSLLSDIILGSPEHAAMLIEWVTENGPKKGWDSIRVYVEAQKAGFHLEAFADNLDNDVKQALIEQGLWPLGGAGVAKPLPSQSGGVGHERPDDDPPETEASSISLEEIIKNMQEDSK